MQTIYQHPWYIQQKQLENTTNLEYLSTQKQKSDQTGPQLIKDISWAAGLWEGEGYLCHTAANRWRLGIKMTDYDVMYSFYQTVNCGTLHPLRNYPSQKENHKPSSQFQIDRPQLIFNVVMMFYPYLGNRRKEAVNNFLAWYYKKGYNETSS